jgi:predicted permease
MATLLQEVRYALRLLAKSPGFAAIAILTLALGIGANTAIFTLLDAVVLKTLPVPGPSRLVVFSSKTGGGSEHSTPPPTGAWRYFPYELYVYLRDQNAAFVGLAAVRAGDTPVAVQMAGARSTAATTRAMAHLVSGNYSSVIGVPAMVGRTLEPADDVPGAKPAAVVSYSYWESQFSGDPAVIGRTVTLNRTPFTVVGVMPRDFFGVQVRKAPDFWVPLHFQPEVELTDSRLTDANEYWLNLIGRLKPGETMAQANAILNVQLRQFLTEQAGSKLDRSARDRIAHSSIEVASGARGISLLRSRYARPLEILLVAVGLVLLIACANVANLLLARATGRRREVSMRLALGATRARLVRQCLTESLVLATLGAAAGTLLAAWGVHALVGFLGQGVLVNVRPDARMLGFTLGVLLVTAILFGVAPALRSTGVEPMLALREHSGRAADGAARSNLVGALVISQVALSVWLLVGAGLLIRSLTKLEEQQFGFDPSNVLLVGINPRIAGYQQGQLPDLYRRLMQRLNSLPGVRSATVASYSPLGGSSSTSNVSIQGFSLPHGASTDSEKILVGPDYTETLGLKLLLGRDIGPQDTTATPRVGVVNEAFVRNFLPGQNPIGLHFGFNGEKHSGDLEIVGVVNDAKYFDVRNAPEPLAFMAIEQGGIGNAPPLFQSELELRTIADPSAMAAQARGAVADVDPHLPITGVTTLNRQVETNFRAVRLTGSVASLLSLLAVVLAAVGLYGLLAYSVARSTSEIGVRMALGARPGDIFWMVGSRGVGLVAVGLGLGIAGSLAVTRAIQSMLFGVSASDPLTYAATACLLAAVAALACYIPARRATRVAPAVALRHE